jgi:hypothetical protein
MARDDGHGACRMADRIPQASKTYGGICMLQFEQCSVGDLGSHAEAYALIVLQICLILMNLRGFKKNVNVQQK